MLPRVIMMTRDGGVTHLNNDIYTLKILATYAGDKYLEVPYAECANGTLVKTYPYATADHQKWKTESNGNYYSIKPLHCLTTAIDVRPSDNRIHIWEADPSNINQKWSLIPVGETLKSRSGNTSPEKASIPNNGNQEWEISYNSFTKNLIIKHPDKNPVKSINIYTINGKLLKTLNVNNKGFIYNLSDLNAYGPVIIRCSTGKEVFSSKIFIQ